MTERLPISGAGQQRTARLIRSKQVGQRQEVSAPAQKSVLVVEDEDNIAIALDYLLTREGYAHSRVASGAEALGRIRDTRPDLVLLDVMLPEVSGYEICEVVRRDPALSAVKILMMTARGSSVERKRGLDLGADGFIAKPFELKALREEVRRILG